MSAPVDVLSVMRYLHDLANESPDFNKADRQESHAAREAVAELIEISQLLLAEREAMGPLNPDWQVFRAALARVGGGA